MQGIGLRIGWVRNLSIPDFPIRLVAIDMEQLKSRETWIGDKLEDKPRKE